VSFLLILCSFYLHESQLRKGTIKDLLTLILLSFRKTNLLFTGWFVYFPISGIANISALCEQSLFSFLHGKNIQKYTKHLYRKKRVCLHADFSDILKCHRYACIACRWFFSVTLQLSLHINHIREALDTGFESKIRETEDLGNAVHTCISVYTSLLTKGF